MGYGDLEGVDSWIGVGGTQRTRRYAANATSTKNKGCFRRARRVSLRPLRSLLRQSNKTEISPEGNSDDRYYLISEIHCSFTPQFLFGFSPAIITSIPPLAISS
jgi:hypothetical protein